MSTLSDELYKDRPISLDEYHKMIDAGMLQAADRMELIGGRIVKMPPVSADHTAQCRKLYELLRRNVQSGQEEG